MIIEIFHKVFYPNSISVYSVVRGNEIVSMCLMAWPEFDQHLSHCLHLPSCTVQGGEKKQCNLYNVWLGIKNFQTENKVKIGIHLCTGSEDDIGTDCTDIT